ncbi:MAG: MBL fold metallo-hydrolase [Candidatus Bathyarchaeia archaeon]|jgi:glyoxylase-like metal-dependent hydrolase (beta-lactamase superfamily II)
MLIETFTVGGLSTNCYIVSSQQTKDAIIIDPGIDLILEADPIFDYIAEAELKVKMIVNTHGHSDHINGDAIFQEKYNVPICIHRLDAASLAVLENRNFPSSILLDDDTLVNFGNSSLKVIHTPGHTPGSICLLGTKLVFTGDTLFAGGIGRTDFPGGSYSEMQLSLQKLQGLPDNFLIYPGHGPTSIIGEEKRVNPFLTS